MWRLLRHPAFWAGSPWLECNMLLVSRRANWLSDLYYNPARLSLWLKCNICSSPDERVGSISSLASSSLVSGVPLFISPCSLLPAPCFWESGVCESGIWHPIICPSLLPAPCSLPYAFPLPPASSLKQNSNHHAFLRRIYRYRGLTVHRTTLCRYEFHVSQLGQQLGTRCVVGNTWWSCDHRAHHVHLRQTVWPGIMYWTQNHLSIHQKFIPSRSPWGVGNIQNIGTRWQGHR